MWVQRRRACLYSVDTVVNYVQDQFRAYLAEESRVKRNPKFLDPRVHVVLYFIPPTLQGCVRRGQNSVRRRWRRLTQMAAW